jgi:hypothetical protein
MKKSYSLLLSVLLLSLFIAKVHAAAQVVTVFDYATAESEMKSFLGNKADGSLLVFDIDDTLVHIPNCLPAEGKNIPSFKRWKVIINDCPYFVTEQRVVDIIKNYQGAGFDTMALTARGPEFIEKSHEQLAGLGISFYGFPFTKTDNFRTKVTSKKYLEFDNALAHASGTSKGKALTRFQYEWFNKPYKRIVFVDDNIKNIKSVNNSFKNDSQTDVLIIHYRKYDD